MVTNGHLNITNRVDSSLYDFCYKQRKARRVILRKSHREKLIEARIAAFDALDSRFKNVINIFNVGDVGYQFLKEFDSGWFYVDRIVCASMRMVIMRTSLSMN